MNIGGWPVLKFNQFGLRGVYLAIGLLIYFCIFFLLLTNAVEDNRWHPYQGTAHDQSGIPIRP